MRNSKLTAVLAAAGMLAALAACGTDDDSGGKAADTPSVDKFALAKGEAVGEPGSATPPQWIGEGAVPEGQPDINGDGKVVVGAITSGDIKDGTYYQSIADAVAFAADQHGWEQTVQGLVPLNQAATAAENLCRQKADLVVIGDSQLVQALTAAKKPACKDTFFYLQGGYGSPEQDDTFTQSYDVGLDYAYVAGAAAGAYMKAKGIESAGFIAGLAAPFNTTIGAVFKQGVLSEAPEADVIETYTGDQIDVGKAVEAFGAQQSQGIGLVYPYFGAPTLAVAKKANAAKIPVLGSPTDVCDADEISFIGTVVFGPGYYLAPLLDDFAAGELELGQTRNWRLGVDPVPVVKPCASAGDDSALIDAAITKAQDDINNGKVNPFALAGDGS
ncbi:BMP family ABC transporter substrate-binding protein [Nocardioides alcanivorans]|uniref:BMP family ABC transporter substrate-binding protein n=1 Tax=Nocardioides alcanivorans TaxID=2897352 RepID=UPI001F452208|nr:BMP family ABC transporter substrate-binding protein [Nocardioides alcanivorans]